MTFQAYLNSFLNTFSDQEVIIRDSKNIVSKSDLKVTLSSLNNSYFSNKNVIGIYLPRSAYYLQIYICLLGAGITAVPLNTEWSDEYIKYVCQSASVSDLIFTTDELTRIDSIFPDHKDNQKIGSIWVKKLQSPSSLDDIFTSISYIVFTSGSTDSPKGVAISRKSLDAYIDNFRLSISSDMSEYHLVTGEIAFDIIIADICIALQQNKRLMITLSSSNIIETGLALTKDMITSCYFVPTGLKLVLDFIETRTTPYDKKILTVYCGGEVLHKTLCRRIWKMFPKARIFNMYGPTETTVNCLSCEVFPSHLDEKSLPTGLPFTHLEYFFDSPDCQPKEGQSGELIVKGVQVMSFYTSRKNRVDGVKISNLDYYRTGDCFKYINGYYYFSHRVDNEVKIRGNRVNLELLRDHCLKTNIAKDILFMYKEPVLVCFIIGFSSSTNELRDHILTSFPAFCLPNKIITLSHLPLNKNGKVDLKFLQAEYL